MKRIIILASILLLLATMFGVGSERIVKGTVSPVIYVDPPMIEAKVGETFSINIFLTPVMNLWGWELKLGYDRIILKCIAALAYAPGGFRIFQDEGYVHGVAIVEPYHGNRTLATLTFQVLGHGSCALHLYDSILASFDAEAIEHITIDGYFRILTPYEDQILIEEIIIPEIKERPRDLIAYKWPAPLITGDVVTPFGPGKNYTVTGEKWFFWVNYCPYAMFAHDTAYVFIDKKTNETEVIVERWTPLLNGAEMWPSPDIYWNPANWVYSTTSNSSISHSVTSETHSSSDHSVVSLEQTFQSQSAKRALIIEGHDASGVLRNASELWYDLMTSFGYSVQDIIYLTPEQRDKTNFICSKQNVTDVIENLSDSLIPGDTLTVFIAAHGDVEQDNFTGYIYLYDWTDKIYDWELNQSLGQIQDGVNITIVMEACYSGSFMDDLWTLKNVKMMTTSTDWRSQCYSASKGLDPPEAYNQIQNWDWNDTNPEDEGCEFSSGLIEGLTELKDRFIGGEITSGYLYVKAFGTARNLDAGYHNWNVLSQAYGPQAKSNPLLTTVFFAGDVTHDGTVNIIDLARAAKANKAVPGNYNWDPEADVDKSREINILDITKIAIEFGNTYY